jgi:hypothetical protein
MLLPAKNLLNFNKNLGQRFLPGEGGGWFSPATLPRH